MNAELLKRARELLDATCVGVGLPRSFDLLGEPVELGAAPPTLRRAELKGQPLELTGREADAKRRELLAALAAGELVELEMDVRAFVQIEGVSNRNHYRIKPSILSKFARTFAGVPYLRDHEQGDSLARAGTVLKSRAIGLEGEQRGKAFDMTVRVTAPWAVESVLRGNTDRFSIGWSYPSLRSIECSACGKPIFTDCYHWPGRVLVDEDTGAETVVEWVFTEAEGVELSMVSVPAVLGTRVDEVRAALSHAAVAAARHDDTPEEQPMDLKKIAKALGLKETASDDEVLAALEAREAAAGRLQEELDAAAERSTELSTQVEALLARDHAREVDALFAEHADRFRPTRDAEGKRAPDPLEVKLRALAAAGADLDNLRGILAALPRQQATPPAGLQSVPTPVAPAAPGAPAPEPVHGVPGYEQPLVPDGREGGTGGLSPALQNVASQLHLSPDDFARFGPQVEQPRLLFGSELTEHNRQPRS